MTTSQDPKALLEQIDTLWQEAWPAFSRLDDDELAASLPGSEWSAKDIMAHFARWEDWHREAIAEHLADGSVRSYRGFSSWNDDWSAQDRSLASPEARERLQSAHTRLVSLLQDLEPEQWDDHVYAFAEQPTLNHFPEHLGLITRER
jgi:hypothetical protein